MRICFSVSNLELGGAQVFVVRLANHLAANHGETVFIYDHWPELRQHHTLHFIHPRVKIISYSENKVQHWLVWKINAFCRLLTPKSEFRHWLNRKRFSKQLEANKIEILNSHMGFSDFVISNSKIPARCRLVLTLHGEYELLLNGDAQEITRQRIETAFKRSQAIIYTAGKNLGPVKLLAPSRAAAAEKINVGFDASGFQVKNISREELGFGKTDFIAGMISRGFPEKGWDTAIKAVKTLNSRNTKKIRLVCIAQGDYVRDLVLEAADENIRLIQFDDNYQDYFSYYPLFDVFLFPTRFEGESVPNVVIESLFWEVPVLASCHAEIPVMLNADTAHAAGICVKTQDADDAGTFADILGWLAGDAAKLNALRKNCAHAFQAFQMKNVADRYLSVFRKVLVK